MSDSLHQFGRSVRSLSTEEIAQISGGDCGLEEGQCMRCTQQPNGTLLCEIKMDG